MESVKKPTNLRACCVKFSEDEWNRITQDRDAFRTSIPKLLKAPYFKRTIQRYLMCEQNEKLLFAHWNIVRSQIDEVFRRMNAQTNGQAPLVLYSIQDLLGKIHGLMVEYHIKQL